MRTHKGLLGAAALAVAFPALAAAQDLQAEIIPLDTWDYDALYETGNMTLDDLLGADVIGPDGDDIGDVENVLFDQDGNILSIIAEVGGFLEIGDTHVNVPWELVSMATWDEGVQIPIDEDSINDYSLFRDGYDGVGMAGPEVVSGDIVVDNEPGDMVELGETDGLDDIGEVETVTADTAITAEGAETEIREVTGDNAGVVDTGPLVWRATDLIGDYARLRGEGDEILNYGYVEDAILRDGMIAAVLVTPDVGYGAAGGRYAYPYYGYGYGWSPMMGTYDMPYGQQDVEAMQPFDRERMVTIEE